MAGFFKRLIGLFRKPQAEHRPPASQIPKETRHEELAKTPAIRVRREKIVLQVGLDFGTSATKVMFSQARRRGVRPVLFEHGLNHVPPYCLPSLVAIDKNKQLLFGTEAARILSGKPWDHGIRRLKVLVAGEQDPRFRDSETHESFQQYVEQNWGAEVALEPRLLTALYLAYVMHAVRLKLTRLQEYRNQDLDFHFNICVPIDYVENNAVRPCFEEVLAWAELIERQWPNAAWDAEQVAQVADLRRLADYGRDTKGGFGRQDQEARVFAVPEAVAEVASYLVSLRRREGIHAIIDLGAGTTDVSIFNLKERELQGQRRIGRDWVSYWYSARSFPRGMTQIERIVASHVGSCTDEHVTKVLGALSDLSAQVRVRIKNREKLEIDMKKEVELLWMMTHKAWQEAYDHRRHQSCWTRNQVQIFVSGGGCHLPGVEYWFKKSWMDLNTQNPWGPYKYSILPEPEEFDTSGNQVPFHRVAVAYGLARPLPELGEFVLPSDAPNHTPPPLPRSEIRCREDGDGLQPRNWV
jgi:hypothetical protein